MITSQQLENALRCAKSYVDSGNLAMVACEISDGSGTLARVAYDPQGEQPSLCDRQFALASISKSITGTVAAVLYEQGILDYEAPITDCIPEFGTSDARRSIKLGQIFNHSTGMPSRYVDGCLAANHGPGGMLELLCNEPLVDAPGTISRYSTHTFQLIGEAILRRTGLTLQQALQRYVCEPCGMALTSFYPSPDLAVPVINHPVPEGPTYEAVERMELAGGGLWSTVDDLTKLGRAWLTPGKLVSAQTYEKTTTIWHPLPVAGDEQVLCRRTLGWNRELGRFANEPESGFFHGGATGTLLYLDPARDLVFVFLTNRWGASNDQAFATLGCLYE